ncbi:hypothetical protein BZA05DRAFT_473312 [Tricharina praecox]|uniref:uncharacterized protein n=1 Tax=Tricharina praecox TaxID=43433 RepID=UPI00221FE8AE|nr:uncharacterized protein BZA05DRAFT_473312 [Tricharina praecox]KAI5853987.1 hypothetical protein BZA05DRAFT_473312 [Tricharina praecox]
MSANNQQPSTVKSYVDSAAATVQNVVGSITGNPIDKQAAADKHVAADAERDASRAGAKAGPLNFSTSGVTVDNEDRIGGKKDQFVGSGKEFMGNTLGNDALVREGRRQNDEGQGREAAGQIKDYVGGAADRVTGAIGSVVAGITGNPQAQSAYQSQHDQGKTNVRGVEADINKQ